MTEPLKCAECGVELTTADADDLVSTDAGPVHRKCFEGPVPPGSPNAGEIVESGFLVAEWGSSWQLTEDGWLVNGEPYNPNEDGVHQPMTPEEEAAENNRRREEGDPPLPPPHVGFNSNHGPTKFDCPECHAEPSIDGGRGLLCRGRSML